MNKKITIAIDAMGGDNSPNKTIEGVSFFLKNNSSKDDFILKLFGDKSKIEKELSNYNINSSKISIIHTDSVVSDEETPLTAIKNSKNTSMWNCIKSQIDGDADISLSAGNTGVLLVISKMIPELIHFFSIFNTPWYLSVKKGVDLKFSSFINESIKVVPKFKRIPF